MEPRARGAPGYDIAAGERVHATRVLDATVNGFVELERSGTLGNRDADSDESWQRILVALDTILRTWPVTPAVNGGAS